MSHQISPLLLLISAPSGGGKTTVCNNLLASEPSIRRAITCTTRPPRPGEIHGVDYHFLTPEQFESGVTHGDFLEHASVYQRRYGTRRYQVLELWNQGFDVLLNIDVQGAHSLRAIAQSDPALHAALVTVFLTPPSLHEIESRLRSRASDPEDAIQRRLAEARLEVAKWPEFDYLLVSGSREDDLDRLRSIYRAERLRRSRARFELDA